jgi:hypothetical protein
MANFRIRMKVQGFELEVDGEREDIPAITNAVKDQLGGFVISGDVVTDGRKQLEATNRGTTDDDKGGRRRNRNAGRSSEAAAAAIEFRHDAAKYGNPIQDWIAAQKCIWLLFVIEGTTGTKEVSGPQLAATFNSAFKASGKLHPPHVTRDLAKEKIKNPAPIGEDKGLYYLTDEGKRQAQQLIESVRAPQ